MDFVVGATGMVGNEICRLLSKDGPAPKVLTRTTSDPDRVQALSKMGCEIVTGDLTAPDSIAAGCESVSTVYSTATALASQNPNDSIESADAKGQIALIDQAKAAGAKRFVFVSVLGLERNTPFASAKLDVEKHLAASGLDFTILQPSCFMDVWLTPQVGFNFIDGEITIYGDGQNKMHWVSSLDVAAAAVDLARNPAARNTTVPILGPQALSPLQVVEIFEETHGRKFNTTHVPEEALTGQIAGDGHPTERSFAGLMLRYAKGDPQVAHSSVELPSAQTTVADFARDAVSS